MLTNRYRFSLIGFVLFLGLLSGISWAQVTSGNISGTVQDETGAVVPGASVTVRNSETGTSRNVTTDGRGRYRASSLPLGMYEVRAEQAGFQSAARTGIELTLGREAVVDFSLKVGSVAETLQVTGEAPLVDTVSGTIAGLVTEERIQQLPLNGRDLDQLMTLEPGVTWVRRGAAGDGSSGYGLRMSIAGARPDMVGWTLDGTDINTDSKGGPGSAAHVQLGVEAIREFQVLTNSYTAEYGSAAGGNVNAVSKSGTNQLHGSGYEFLRNDNLDAASYFDNFAGRARPEFRRNQFGASVGGPVVKDRMFYFGNYEGLRGALGTTQFGRVPTAEARLGILPGRAPLNVHPFVKTLLPLYPLPNGQDLRNGTGEFINSSSQRTRADYFTVRLDHSFNSNHSLFGRYTFDHATNRNPDAILLAATGSRTRHQYFTLEETGVLSARWLNKFRLGYNRSYDAEDWTPLRDIAPLMLTPLGFAGNFSVPTLTGLGLPVSNPRIIGLTHYELANDVEYSSGLHNAKFGIMIGEDRIYQNTASPSGGQWLFNGLPDFLAGTVQSFLGPLPGTDAIRHTPQWLYGFYVQDSFHLLPRLNVNVGLRYEFITVPTEINGKMGGIRFITDKAATAGPLFQNPSLKNFAPRAGFAWDPSGNGKTSVRGGFGLFYDQVIRAYWRIQTVRQPPFYVQGQVLNPPIENTYQVLVNQGRSGALTADTTSMDYDVHTPYLLQYNLNVQRQLSSTVVATIGYAGSHGLNLDRAKEGNSAIPTILPDGRKFFPVGSGPRNPIFASDRRSIFDGQSRYNSLQVGIRKRFSRGLHLQSSWTWSKAIDEGSSVFAASLQGEFVTIDPDNHKSNRGLALFDVRHNWISNFLWEIPLGRNQKGLVSALVGGWQLGGIITVQSGTPDTPTLSFNNSRNQSSRNLFEVPDLKPGASKNPILNSRDVSRYFDSSAFSLAAPGFFGNLGRNTLIGPGIATVDSSIYKTASLQRLSENLRLEFRAEFFNLLNRANFRNPLVKPVLLQGGAPNPAAGTIRDTSTSSRQIQFGMKVIW